MDLDDIVRRIQLEPPIPSSEVKSAPPAAAPGPQAGVFSDPDFRPSVPAADPEELYSDPNSQQTVRE